MLTVLASLLIVKSSNSCLERGLRVRDGQDYRVRKQVLTPIAIKNPDKFYQASIGTKPDRQFDVTSHCYQRCTERMILTSVLPI